MPTLSSEKWVYNMNLLQSISEIIVKITFKNIMIIITQLGNFLNNQYTKITLSSGFITGAIVIK